MTVKELIEALEPHQNMDVRLFDNEGFEIFDIRHTTAGDLPCAKDKGSKEHVIELVA